MAAGNKVLVLGATGPSGICVVRELIHHQQQTIIYARNPTKVPEDIRSDSLVEIIQGEMTDRMGLSRAVSKCKAIVSLLGPTSLRQPANSEFADYYRSVLGLMQEHAVKRILVMGTTSIYRPEEDKASLTRWFFSQLIKILAYGAYYNIVEIGRLFENHYQRSTDQSLLKDIQWTVFRLGNLAGASDFQSWNKDRDLGQIYLGPVAGPGWTTWINRSLLAKWLVDQSGSDIQSEWIGGFPAVSQMAN